MHRLLGLHSVFDSRPNVGISCSAFSFFLFLVFLLQINIFWGGKKAKMTAKSRPVLRIRAFLPKIDCESAFKTIQKNVVCHFVLNILRDV